MMRKSLQISPSMPIAFCKSYFCAGPKKINSIVSV
jgi:hypothetical protein